MIWMNIILTIVLAVWIFVWIFQVTKTVNRFNSSHALLLDTIKLLDTEYRESMAQVCDLNIKVCENTHTSTQAIFGRIKEIEDRLAKIERGSWN